MRGPAPIPGDRSVRHPSPAARYGWLAAPLLTRDGRNLGLIQLSQKGSLYVTRPTLAHYIASREDLEQRSQDVFAMIANGRLKLRIEHTYPLQDAVKAHRDLEGRKTTGKLLLLN